MIYDLPLYSFVILYCYFKDCKDRTNILKIK
jgi:hypothetical protein